MTSYSDKLNQSTDFHRNNITITVLLYNQSSQEETVLEQWCLQDNCDEVKETRLPNANAVSVLCRQLYTFLRLTPSYRIYREKKKNSELKVSLTHRIHYEKKNYKKDIEFCTVYDKIKFTLDLYRYIPHYQIPSNPIMTSTKVIDDYDPKSLPKEDELSKSPSYGSSSNGGSLGKSPTEVLFLQRNRTSSQTGSIKPFLNSPSTKSSILSSFNTSSSNNTIIVDEGEVGKVKPKPGHNSFVNQSSTSYKEDDLSGILTSLGELKLPSRDIHDLVYNSEEDEPQDLIRR